MSWKRKSPGAHRRTRLRRQRRRWSYGYWLLLQKQLFRDLGMSGPLLQRAARLAARYVTRAGSPHELLKLVAIHSNALSLRWIARTAAAHNSNVPPREPFQVRITF
jgi:hypothetical protein